MSDRIAPGSTLIRNTLARALDGLLAPVMLTASEFDDVRVAVQSKAEDADVLVVSIAGPAGALPEGAREVAAGAYAQYASVRAECSHSVHCSCSIASRTRPRPPRAQRNSTPLTSNPLRFCLTP
jgi:hypothetical protein